MSAKKTTPSIFPFLLVAWGGYSILAIAWLFIFFSKKFNAESIFEIVGTRYLISLVFPGGLFIPLTAEFLRWIRWRKDPTFSMPNRWIPLLTLSVLSAALAIYSVLNYPSFARRQGGGNLKRELNRIFEAEQKFFNLSGRYSADLHEIGYAPTNDEFGLPYKCGFISEDEKTRFYDFDVDPEIRFRGAVKEINFQVEAKLRCPDCRVTQIAFKALCFGPVPEEFMHWSIDNQRILKMLDSK
jgi:hypothetical protein